MQTDHLEAVAFGQSPHFGPPGGGNPGDVLVDGVGSDFDAPVAALGDHAERPLKRPIAEGLVADGILEAGTFFVRGAKGGFHCRGRPAGGQTEGRRAFEEVPSRLRSEVVFHGNVQAGICFKGVVLARNGRRYVRIRVPPGLPRLPARTRRRSG